MEKIKRNDDLDLDGIRAELKSAYTHADKGKRFLNYILDSILSTILLYVGLFLLGGTLALFSDSTGDANLFEGVLFAVLYLLSLLLPVAYYVFFEHYSNGKTLGKIITKTRVVRKDGSKPSFGQIVGRSFARLIPFEAFSVLGSDKGIGWHDSLSGTVVIEDIR